MFNTKKIVKKWSILDVFRWFFLPLQNWWFLPPDDQKPPYDDVTVPVADVFCCCHGFSAVAVVPVVAGIHLDDSFPALTAITAVADDQCHAVAGFLSLLRSPSCWGPLSCWVPCCCWCPYCCWLNCFYWRPCYCFLAVACIHDINSITDIPCYCFGVLLMLASMLLWHTGTLLFLV